MVEPGALTAAHVNGQRRSYIGPLALFFLANAAFVMLQSFLGSHVLSSPLASHLNNQDWSSLARIMVADRLREQGQTLSDYAPVFDQAVTLNAKLLIILMVLIFVPLPMALFKRVHRTVGAHFVFALHLYAFVLILLCGSLLMAEAQRQVGGRGLASPTVDLALSVFNLLACAVYIYLALGPAYGAKGLSRIAKAGVLAMAVGSLFVAYRFAIFLITLYTT